MRALNFSLIFCDYEFLVLIRQKFCRANGMGFLSGNEK